MESCLETPLQTFAGEEPYPTFIGKVSLLFYLLIKNHPFQNGNKRIAVMTLFVVLYLNHFWIDTEELEPYNLAIRVTKSEREDKEKVYKMIKRFIINNIKKLDDIS